MSRLYKIRNLSFSAETEKYCKSDATLFFSHADAYGVIEVEDKGSIKGRLVLILPHLEGALCTYLFRDFSKAMEDYGGFEKILHDFGRFIPPVKEIALSPNDYETYTHSQNPDWLTFCFTERQLNGKVSLFKIHTTKID